MLDASISNLIEMAATDERATLLKDCIMFLESMEYDSLQAELLNIIYESFANDEAIEKPESVIMDEIHLKLVGAFIDQLRSNGIEVDPDAKLKDLYDLTVGISHIPTYEDMGSIVAACGSDDGPVDQLSEILQLVTTISSEHWHTVVEDVSKQLISTIIEYGGARANDEYDQIEATDRYLSKLRAYSEFVDKLDRKLAFFELVESNKLGLPFTKYIDSGVVSEYFDGNEMDKLAMELYGMALMSADGNADPVTAIRNTAEQYINDPARLLNINIEAGKINAAFVKFYQTSAKEGM